MPICYNKNAILEYNFVNTDSNVDNNMAIKTTIFKTIFKNNIEQ